MPMKKAEGQEMNMELWNIQPRAWGYTKYIRQLIIPGFQKLRENLLQP